jgi:hypothetical protein
MVSLVAGRTAQELGDKVAEQKEERARIQEKIKQAGELGKLIQQTIKIGLSIVTLNPEEIAGGLVEIGKGIDEAAFGDVGFLGRLAQQFASDSYKKELKRLDASILALQERAKGAVEVERQEAFEGKVKLLHGAFLHLEASVEKTALTARKLRDVMKSPPKARKRPDGAANGHSPDAEHAAAPEDAKDPAKRVEVFVTSAIATTALLDGGIAAAASAEKPLFDRLGELGKSRIDGSEIVEERDVIGDHANDWFKDMDKSYESRRYRPPEKEGVVMFGPDMDVLYTMFDFVSQWRAGAEKQHRIVKAQADQARSLKGR